MGNTEAKPEEDVQEQPPGIVLNSYQHSENRKHLDVAHKADSNSKSPAHAGSAANQQAEKPKRAMWDFGKAKGDDDAGSTKPSGVAVEGEKQQQQQQQETKQQEGSFFKMFSGKEATGAADGKNDRGENGSREPAGRRDTAAAATGGGTAGQQQQQKESGGSFSLKQMFGGKDSAAPAADEEAAQNAAGKAESAMNGPVAKTTLPAARGRSAEKLRAAQPAAEVGADVHEAVGEADASGKEPQGFFSFLKKGPSDMTDGAGHSGGLLRLQSVSLQEPADEGLPSDSASLSDARSSSSASAAAFGGFFRSMGGKRTATVATQTEPVQVLPIKDNPFSFRKKM